MARHVNGATAAETSSYNRWHEDGKINFIPCLAAECMMWRWDFRTSNEGNPDLGRCGLAGETEQGYDRDLDRYMKEYPQ